MTTFLKAVGTRALLFSGLALATSGFALSGCVSDYDPPSELQDPFAGSTVVDPADGTALPPIIVDPGFPTDERPLPSVFAESQFHPSNLSVVGDAMYWIEEVGAVGHLNHMHVDGGASERVAKFESLPFSSAVDEFGIYLSAPAEGRVLFVAHNELAVYTLHEASSQPLAVALTEDDALWTDTSGCLVRGPKDGRQGETLGCADAPAVTLAIVGDDAYFATVGGALFHAGLGSNGTFEMVFGGQEFGDSIVADQSGIYWLDATSRSVMRYRFASQEIGVLAEFQYSPAGIAQDRFYLYYTSRGDGAVKRVLKAGGDIEVMAEGQAQPGQLVSTDEYLYWINEGSTNEAPGNGSIMRINKGFDY